MLLQGLIESLKMQARHRRIIAKVSQIGALCLTLGVSACGPEEKSVPVDLRIGYNATTTLEPVEVEIYEYVHPQSRPPDFRVTSEPPLRFIFPAAYYANTESIAGGPVARMDLAFDRKSWKPYEIAVPKRRRGEPPLSNSEDRKRRLRFLHVSVHSNVSPSGWVPGKSLETLQRSYQPVDEIGSFNGFKLYSYASSVDRPVEPLAPIVFDGIDFNGHNTIVGIVDMASSESRYLRCFKIGRCEYFFIYYGRHVQMVLNKSDLPIVTDLEAQLRKIFDSHLVDSGSFPP